MWNIIIKLVYILIYIRRINRKNKMRHFPFFFQESVLKFINFTFITHNMETSSFLPCLILATCSTHLIIRHRGVVGRVPAFQNGGPGSIPDGVRNFNSYSGIGCVSFVFCPVLSPAEALTFCWPHIQGGPPLCICLVFRSIDNCSSYRHLTHGHFSCKSRGGSPILEEGK